MKKILLVLAISGLMLSACHSNTTNSSAGKTDSAKGAVMPSGPKFKFENDTHDFGKIKEGDKVTYKFNFANVGKAPLIISKVEASCGCTKPEWPTTPVKPGEGGQITVTYDSAGHNGLVDKMITITANTDTATTTLHLVGEVLKK
jgi:hypothetical protein